MVVDGGRLVLGGDVGGTSTRIVVADETGRILATARSRGANPTVEPRMAAETLRGAVEDALRQVPGARIEVAVIGMAGGGALDDGDVRDAFATAWRSTGIGCRPEAVADVEVAFASGTAASDGTVLIAGTGAAAGAIRDRAVHHTADGYGWLLGDDGSGYWLGREAVRATLRALDLRQPPGALARGVLDSLLGTVSAGAYRSLVDGDRTTCIRLHGALVNRIYQRPPTWLAELAPLVTAAYRQGDQAAKAITARAVQLLADTVAGVRTPEEDTPIVLAGGVLAESPVGPALRTLLGTRYAGPITTARDGSAGSAWLALTRLDRHDATDASHRRLMETSVP